VLNQENNLTPLVGIALCYLLITIPLSIVVRRMEARAGRAR
jgi:polar amino acid transport system permease protein